MRLGDNRNLSCTTTDKTWKLPPESTTILSLLLTFDFNRISDLFYIMSFPVKYIY